MSKDEEELQEDFDVLWKHWLAEVQSWSRIDEFTGYVYENADTIVDEYVLTEMRAQTLIGRSVRFYKMANKWYLKFYNTAEVNRSASTGAISLWQTIV